MSDCLVCANSGTESLIDFGSQPVSSHYRPLPELAATVPRFPLQLALCPHCGVLQLARPFPYESLVPPYSWITYREPEDHLDAVLERLLGMGRYEADTRIRGITFKDATLLERFGRQGFEKVYLLDPEADVGVTHTTGHVETMQALLTPARAEAIVRSRGHADILIARHIVEHASAPRRFLNALEKMLAPEGLLILEVPDCARSLDLRDYTMLWEEHTLYLTEATFRTLLVGLGFQILGVDRYSYPFEDVLVMYARRDPDRVFDITVIEDKIAAAQSQAVGFAGDFRPQTAVLKNRLNRLRQAGPIALYGAGHLTCAFVNLHQVSHYFEFVVDDTPMKQGLFLPGNALEIVPREWLAASAVKTCLLGLAPELENKVIANNESFLKDGAVFQSIFAASGRSVWTN